MSDPVTNADIEDVLSSIRRLVSEEPASLQKRKSAADDANDRFVLTPALRIAENDEIPAEPAQTAPEPPLNLHGAEESHAAADAGWQPDESAHGADHDTGRDIGHEIGQDIGDDTEPAPETAVDQPSDIAEDTLSLESVSADPDRHELPETAENTGHAEPDHADTPSGSDLDHPESEHQVSLEQRIAELETALGHSTEEWEPDGSEVVANPGGPKLAFTNPDRPDGQGQASVPFDDEVAAALAGVETGSGLPDAQRLDPFWEMATVAGDAGDIDGAADAAQMAETADQGGPTLHERDDSDENTLLPDAETHPAFRHTDVEAEADSLIEMVIGDQASGRTDAEPHEAVPTQEADLEMPAPGGTTETWVDAERGADQGLQGAEAEQIADPTESSESEPAEPALDLYGDEAMLDEESLREMVSDIVRQELQGVLGERITRNVRRLVRREIQRALAVRELD